MTARDNDVASGGTPRLRDVTVREVLSPSIGGQQFRVEQMAFADGGRMVVATADGLFWWNWDRDRQASRAQPERWPIPTDAITEGPFAVVSVEGVAGGAAREPVLAVVDRGSRSALYFASSGQDIGRTAIDADWSTGIVPSITSTQRGFVLSVGRSILHYAIREADGGIRATLLGEGESPLPPASISSTPDARRVVAAIDGIRGGHPG